MSDLARSLALLGAAFAAVVVLTVGLALVVIPGPAVSSQADPSAVAAHSMAASPSPVPGTDFIGGLLTVTGDREGDFVLTSASFDGPFGLTGDAGRIVFGSEEGSLTVTQLSYGGWDFFPEPDECTITVGDVDHETGIGEADLACEDIADLRDNGVISIAGRLGLAADMLGQRGVPPSGGSLAVGDETWSFDGAFMALWDQPAVAGVDPENMVLLDEAAEGVLYVSHDSESHRTWISAVAHAGERSEVPDDACTIDRTELGRPNPNTMTVELTLRCAAIDIDGLGTVPIEGTLVVDEVGFSY